MYEEICVVTIIFAHPWHGSFNYAILETITDKLEKIGRDFQLLT
jgi:NAD(P)H dehydrogenase (quinone)